MDDDRKSPWVDGLTIGEMLRRTAAKYPDRDAFVFPRLDHARTAAHRGTGVERRGCLRLSYRQFDAAVDRVAKALLGLGIQKGDHVAVWATNWPKWILLQFATARIGAVMVLINPAYRTSELSYVLKQSDAVALFLVDAFRGSDYFAMVESGGPGTRPVAAGRFASAAKFPRLRHVVSMTPTQAAGMWAWDAFIAWAKRSPTRDLKARESKSRRPSRSMCNTRRARPDFRKGPCWPIAICCSTRFTSACANGSPRPTGFASRCRFTIASAACWGRCAVPFTARRWSIPAEYFDPEATLNAIESERATAVYGVPTMFIAQLEHPTFAGRDLKSLRTGVMAGSPCPIELMKRVVDQMGAREITIAYGLTETRPSSRRLTPTIRSSCACRRSDRPCRGSRSNSSIRPASQTLGDNEQGELCTRGHGVMLGYYKMPEATAAAIDRGGMAALGRSRTAAAQWLLPHYRPHQGHDLPRRGEHLSPRDRGVSAHASGDRERGRLRRAGPQIRRGCRRLGQAPRRPEMSRRRLAGLLQKVPRPL